MASSWRRLADGGLSAQADENAIYDGLNGFLGFFIGTMGARLSLLFLLPCWHKPVIAVDAVSRAIACCALLMAKRNGIASAARLRLTSSRNA